MEYQVAISLFFCTNMFALTREMIVLVALYPKNMFAQWTKKSLIEKKGYQDRKNSQLIALSD